MSNRIKFSMHIYVSFSTAQLLYKYTLKNDLYNIVKKAKEVTKKNWIKRRIRSGGFLRIFTVALTLRGKFPAHQFLPNLK